MGNSLPGDTQQPWPRGLGWKAAAGAFLSLGGQEPVSGHSTCLASVRLLSSSPGTKREKIPLKIKSHFRGK